MGPQPDQLLNCLCRVPTGANRQATPPRRLPGRARSRNVPIFREEFNPLPVLSLCRYTGPREAAKDNFPLLF